MNKQTNKPHTNRTHERKKKNILTSSNEFPIKFISNESSDNTNLSSQKQKMKK